MDSFRDKWYLKIELQYPWASFFWGGGGRGLGPNFPLVVSGRPVASAGDHGPPHVLAPDTEEEGRSAQHRGNKNSLQNSSKVSDSSLTWPKLYPAFPPVTLHIGGD
jgi:hypothetical protein